MERVRNFFATHKRGVITASIIVVAVILLGLAIYFVLFSAKLYLMVAPSESVKVTVNGKEYKSGRHVLLVGHKKVEISGEGIEGETIELNMLPFSNEAILRAYVPNGDFSAYKQNGNDYIVLKHYSNTVTDESINTFVSKMERAYYLKNELPFNNSFHNSYGRMVNSEITDASDEEQCRALICLRLDKDTDYARNATRENLALRGYDMDDYVFFYGELEGADDEQGQ